MATTPGTEIRSKEDVRRELDALLAETGFVVPDRAAVFANPDTVWRYERPDYDAANLEYLKGKTQDHAKGSLEETVENLVKCWESEASHKEDFSQWATVDHCGAYTISANGAPALAGREAKEIGNYNALMRQCPTYQKMGPFSFEESHDLFRHAFPEGFPWEVLKVFSAPPAPVLFSWRHWASFSGSFRGRAGDGSTLEMVGLGRVELTEAGKVGRLEVFFEPATFLEVLMGEKDVSALAAGKAVIGDLTKTALQRKRASAAKTKNPSCSLG